MVESIGVVIGDVTVFVGIVTTIFKLINLINYNININIHYQIKKFKVTNFKLK